MTRQVKCALLLDPDLPFKLIFIRSKALLPFPQGQGPVLLTNIRLGLSGTNILAYMQEHQWRKPLFSYPLTNTLVCFPLARLSSKEPTPEESTWKVFRLGRLHYYSEISEEARKVHLRQTLKLVCLERQWQSACVLKLFLCHWQRGRTCYSVCLQYTFQAYFLKVNV
jgi:hypothetical protein